MPIVPIMPVFVWNKRSVLHGSHITSLPSSKFLPKLTNIPSLVPFSLSSDEIPAESVVITRSGLSAEG